jgi:di/tricarboxylate transporter
MTNLLREFEDFFKKETVLMISGIAAITSMFLVPPSKEYLAYIDFRVLGLLFCLMTVVAGFQKTGIFLLLSEKILMKVANIRSISFVLVILCFLTSMWITNDVALITFVPLALLVLTMTAQTKYIIRIVVLQTIAANLGSMLTPVGNPQNLYLYSNYNISIGEFLSITLPFTLFSFLLLIVSIYFIPKEHISFTLTEKEKPAGNTPYLIAMYSGLFLLCLACVIHLIDYRIVILIVLLLCFLFDRTVFKKVDYSLILTFVFFFLFVGNIGNIPFVNQFLASLLQDRELTVSILASQIISNVPAAVLLSSFTNNYKAMMIGTNLGGLGTLVASLASLISYKLYIRIEGAKPGRYLFVFTIYNVIFLALLYLLTFLLY